MEDVIAVAALQVVIAAGIRDDVVAGAAQDDVVAVTAVEPVVAPIAIDRVVADTREDDVIAGGAAQDHMGFAGVLEIVRVWASGRGVVPDHEREKRREGASAARIGAAVNAQASELLCRVDLEGKGWRLEDYSRKMRRIGVRHDQFGERVVLELGVEVEPGGALQVVEPVAVLQLFELVLEHKVKGRTQQAAKRHLLLGHAADPEVDVVETGSRHAVWSARPEARTVQEVEAV